MANDKVLYDFETYGAFQMGKLDGLSIGWDENKWSQ